MGRFLEMRSSRQVSTTFGTRLKIKVEYVVRLVLERKEGYLPWGVCPGEYGGLRNTLSLDKKFYTRFRIAQLE